jgi:hypothetical protein
MASKDETLESASRGTIRCSAVYQRVPHKSKVIPKKNAQIAILKEIVVWRVRTYKNKE